MTETLFKDTPKDTVLKVRIPHALKDDLVDLACRAGVPVSQVVRGILAFGVDALWDADGKRLLRHLRIRPRTRRQELLD